MHFGSRPQLSSFIVGDGAPVKQLLDKALHSPGPAQITATNTAQTQAVLNVFFAFFKLLVCLFHLAIKIVPTSSSFSFARARTSRASIRSFAQTTSDTITCQSVKTPSSLAHTTQRKRVPNLDGALCQISGSFRHGCNRRSVYRSTVERTLAE